VHGHSIHYSQHLKDLERACRWFGVSKGRSLRYRRLIEEFFRQDKRTREHVLVYNESFEITELYRLWEAHVARFRGLKERMRNCLEKGPILREDERENPVTNRWRDHLFEYFLAGKLINGSVPVVVVDGIVAEGESSSEDADILFRFNERICDIECKRPRKHGRLLERVKEARNQIQKTHQERRQGLLAIDCSLFITELGHPFKATSEDELRLQIHHVFETELKPVVASHLDASVLGVLLYVRLLARTQVHQSSIHTLRGEPYTSWQLRTVQNFTLISDSILGRYVLNCLAQFSETSILRIHPKVGSLDSIQA